MTDVLMRDCTSALVPDLRKYHPETVAAGYVTGGPGIEWTEPQFASFARKIRICQEAGVPGEAAHARAIDVERGAARAADIVPFCQRRQRIAPDDTVYSNVSSMDGYTDEQLTTPSRWWVALWLTGAVPLSGPSRDRVYAALSDRVRSLVPPERIWAWQFRSDQFWDTSVVYGAKDFSR